MKSFKTFIDEAIKRSFGFSAGVGSDTFQKPAEDSVKNMSDLADPEILKRVNSFVSGIADAEYIQPMAAVEQLRSKLEALGLSFGDVQMEGKSGSVSLDVVREGNSLNLLKHEVIEKKISKKAASIDSKDSTKKTTAAKKTAAAKKTTAAKMK